MNRRREFSTDVKRKAYARSCGICECHLIPGMIPCGRPLGEGNTFYEHIVCDGIGGEPTLDNCAAITRTCWRLKTDRYDLPIVARTKRRGDRARNIKAQPSRPLPGGRFTNLKLRINGPPVDRRTGEPWREMKVCVKRRGV